MLGLTGCPASGDEVRPPRDQIFFPSGVTLDPSEQFLFVTNANSELRYDSGTVVAVELDAVDAVLDGWLSGRVVPDGCSIDPVLRHILQCDESLFIPEGAAVRIGNFSTSLGLQELASGDLRLFVPVRGDPSVTWIDFATGTATFDCGGTGAFPACDDAHRLDRLRGDVALPALPNEPFDIHVDSGNGYAVITHLTQAAVTLLDAPTDGSEPRLVDVVGGLFLPSQGGARGAVGIAGRRPGSPEDLIYVTSRTENRVQMLYVHRPEDPAAAPQLVASEYFFMEQVLPSIDGRGIAFGADGDRAYIINRNPPVLQLIDTSLSAAGFPVNRLDVPVEICRDAAQLTVGDPGEGERGYVACFPAGQLWRVDPVLGMVDATIDVGRGPHSVALSESRQRLYVANFLEDTLGVVDVRPDSASENLMVMRIGRPRQSEEN